MDKLDYEKAMGQWDSAVDYIAKGGKASWPRDMFESYLDHIQELENMGMTEQKAREILGDWIDEGGLWDIPRCVQWEKGSHRIDLQGVFEPDELEALAWWMRNFKEGHNED